MNYKELTEKAESVYANCPPSGRGDSSIIISKDMILKDLRPISLRKPFALIVGSVATQGESNNDIDIVVRGEDFSDKLKEAISFRLYRYMTDVIKCKYDDVTKYVHLHWNNEGAYTSYTPLFELNLVPITDMGTIQMSNDKMPVSIIGNFNILNKAEGTKRIIAGYASVIEVDQQNHIIPKATLEEGVKTLLKDTDYANLMLVHQNIQIGKILPVYNDLSTHVDDKGLFIVAELRNDLEIANKLWDKISKGDINSFSISGEVLLDHKECNEEKCVRIIDKINIFEVSVCSSPVNKDSGFVVISKGDSVCNDVNIDILNKGNDYMTEIKKDNPPCPDCTPPVEVPKKEFNIQEAIDYINREITAIKGIIEEMKAKNPMGNLPPKEEVPGAVPPAEPVPPTPPANPEENKYPLPKAVDNAQPCTPPKEEKPSEYPYPSKKDFDELKKSFESLMGIITKNKKLEEMDVIVKSKDEEIAGLIKRVEVLSKTELEPKTTVEPKKDVPTQTSMFVEDVRQKSGDLTIPVKSDMKLAEPKDISLVKDTITPGVYYKDPDLM
jgi:HK97 family phage prohead protease